MAQIADNPRRRKIDYVMELWRHLQTRIKEMNDNELSFEELSKAMKKVKLILLTANFYGMLSSFAQQTPLSNSKDSKSADKRKAKQILSSLMMIKFPLDVLDIADVKDLDPLSERCYKSANKLVDALLINIDEKQSKLQCIQVLNLINSYCESFEIWVSQDKEKVLQSIQNYYEQWSRSYNVLSKASMNEAQRKIILNTLATNMNKTELRIAHLVGKDKASEICKEIQDRVNSEPDAIQTNQTNQTNQMQAEFAGGEVDKEEEKKEMTLEQKLAAKGVPMNIKTGRNLLKEPVKKQTKVNAPNSNTTDEKYVKLVNGQKMLDLDVILKEEGSKVYWEQFGKQIENEDFSRLFELLTELLERIKKISPQKQHKHLNDLLDVQFIQQTIENKNIDAKGFYGIFYGIWSQIKTLHAPSEDKSWDAWHESIIQSMSADTASWANLLPNVFNSFFKKLDSLEDKIAAIKEIKGMKQKHENKKSN